MRKPTSLILLAMILFAFPVGYAHSEEKGIVTYVRDVSPVIQKRCSACHGSNAPSVDDFKRNKETFLKQKKGPRMDSYNYLLVFVNGSDTGALMRRLDDGKNTKDGKPGNMFTFLGETDREKAENLELIKRWVGGWTLKRKAEITEAERGAIKAQEN